MSNRQQEFRIGVVALAVGAIAALLVTLNTSTALRLTGKPYSLQIRVDRAPGVGPGTPIRKDGVLIGRVAAIQFLPEGGVLVSADIKPMAPIYASDVCRIRPTSLFGDAVIDFAYDVAAGAPTPVEPGATVTGSALPDPVEALTSLQLDLGPTLESIDSAASSFTELTNRFNRALGEDFDGARINGVLDEVTITLDEFQRTMSVISGAMQQVDQLASDPRLVQGLDTVPDLLADARTTVQRATETLDSLANVVDSAEANLTNLEGFTEPLGERGAELSQLLTESIENLNATLADASRFVTAVTDSRGSLSRLLNDPELYDNVATVVANANSVMIRFDGLLRQMRPILGDVRVITDKVAREPSRPIWGAWTPGVGVK